MLGVIIWGEENTGKAVIWCEGQNSLAYLEGHADLADSARWPNVGDLVELEGEETQKHVYARQVRVVPQSKTARVPPEIHCPHNPNCKSISFPVCNYTSPDCHAICG